MSCGPLKHKPSQLNSSFSLANLFLSAVPSQGMKFLVQLPIWKPECSSTPRLPSALLFPPCRLCECPICACVSLSPRPTFRPSSLTCNTGAASSLLLPHWILSYPAVVIAPKSGRIIDFEIILWVFHCLQDKDLLTKAYKCCHDLPPAYLFNFHCSPQLCAIYFSHSIFFSFPRTCCEVRSDHKNWFAFQDWLELRLGSR